MSHTDHRITYNEDSICEYEILSIDTENGVVEFDLRSSQIVDMREKFLFCEDCQKRLDPEELGLDKDWFPVDKNTFVGG
jgi:hypothetical protein